MTELKSKLEAKAIEALKNLYSLDVESVELQPTRKDFEGDVTIVVFPYLRASRKGPEQTAEELGKQLQESVEEISAYNVVKGFLNLSISNSYWANNLNEISSVENYGIAPEGDNSMMVEYSSPNTNKPLHLGHIRNNLLGYSVSEILKAAGNKVTKVQIINDRGIHICKSMLAYQKFGDNETPNSSGMKGDKLVGYYYVKFETEYQKELSNIRAKAKEIYEQKKEEWKKKRNVKTLHVASQEEKAQLIIAAIVFTMVAILFVSTYSVDEKGRLKKRSKRSKFKNSEIDWPSEETEIPSEIREKGDQIRSALESKFLSHKFDSRDQYKMFRVIVDALKKESPLIQEAQAMLKKWEQGDAEVVKLWETMNGWVYKGFEETYTRLGVDFDKYYYESDTYLLGKRVVEEGLEKGVFEKDPDGSVWIDLTDEGLDRKILLRSDGTSVYMTQDIGTAIQRFEDFSVNGMIYTVGNEQDYHFKVLFLILDKLGYSWAKNLYHLSYGMVDLPTGKMKSREGTVVDADDLIDQMEETAGKISEELGKTEGMTPDEKKALYHMVGMGALKYYILRVDPRKRMMFNPEESIDFQGNTGPFIQYTHARIKSLLRRGEELGHSTAIANEYQNLQLSEKELVKALAQFPETIQEAAENHSPALVANYIYELVKLYNALYQQLPILQDDDKSAIAFRLKLSASVASVIKTGMRLLGIDVPERM